jgi:hypothetical protein
VPNLCTRRRAVLQQETNISLSAKGPSSTSAQYLALGEGVAPTPNGGAGCDGKRAFDESQGRLSAHIYREGRGKISAKGALPVELQREAFAERIPTLGEDPESCSGVSVRRQASSQLRFLSPTLSHPPHILLTWRSISPAE